MPLLPLEPFLFPEDFLAQPVQEGPGRWWALHTKPRVEKTLARQLLRRRAAFFLPLFKKVWRARGRALQSYTPLFPGYLFLHGDAETRIKALETNLVVHSIHVVDQAQLSQDLASVYRAIESDSVLTPEEQLVPGSPVEVVDGPLAGMFGKVIRKGASCRFVIEVKFLQQGVSVDIEQWMFRPVSSIRLAQENTNCY